MSSEEGLLPRCCQVLRDHFGTHFSCRGTWVPSKLLSGLDRAPQEIVDFCRAKIPRVDGNDDVTHFHCRRLVPAYCHDNALFLYPGTLESKRQPEFIRRPAHELPNRMLFPGGDHIVIRNLLLEHEPLHAHVVSRMVPVPHRVQIPQEYTRR